MTEPSSSARDESQQGVVRLSVNVNAETAAWLRVYAHERGCSVTEVVRRTVAIAKWVTDEVGRGHRVLVDDGGCVKELKFLV